MAFVFNAASGSSTANSYVTVAEADDYFAGTLGLSNWTALSAARKQGALVQATNRIDSESFGGQLTDRTQQVLQWPRSYVLTRDTRTSATNTFEVNGYYYRDPVIIPREIKQATFELAYHYIIKDSGEFTVDDNDLETLTSYKVGPLDLGIKDGIKADRLPTKVTNLLKALGANGWLAGQPLRFTA